MTDDWAPGDPLHEPGWYSLPLFSLKVDVEREAWLLLGDAASWPEPMPQWDLDGDL